MARWLDHEVREMVHLKRQGIVWRIIATRVGHTEKACKDKYRMVSPQLPADPKPPESHDDTYVGMCLAQGGFCWLSERRNARGEPVACLPLNWPTMRRAA